MAFSLYRLLAYFTPPFIVLRLLWRSMKQPAYRQHCFERFGLHFRYQANEPVVWLHAVSVGESLAALPIIHELLQQHQGTVLITSMTPTGANIIKERLGDKVLQAYLPYDIGWCIRRFMKHFQPTCLILMETELWPNLLYNCKQHKLPVMLANARMSARSAKRYRRFYAVIQHIFSTITVAAQTSHDARRFIALGVPKPAVQVLGNVKYDAGPPDNFEATYETFLPLVQDRWIMVAASTHPGEDECLIEAFIDLKAKQPQALLWLVPRHPDRAEDLLQLAKRYKLQAVRRTAFPCDVATADIVIADTIGEMWSFLALADVVFMGGSLIQHGGQNLLEPALLQKAIMTGPSCFNFSDVFKRLVQQQALMVVDKTTLSAQLLTLADNPQQRKILGMRAFKVASKAQGATSRHMNWLKSQHWWRFKPTNG